MRRKKDVATRKDDKNIAAQIDISHYFNEIAKTTLSL